MVKNLVMSPYLKKSTSLFTLMGILGPLLNTILGTLLRLCYIILVFLYRCANFKLREENEDLE